MRRFIYARRNPRNVFALWACAFAGVFGAVLLHTIVAGLQAEKLQYIEVYRNVRAVRATSSGGQGVMADIDEVPVKLILGQGQMQVFKVRSEDVPALAAMIGVEVNSDGEVVSGPVTAIKLVESVSGETAIVPWSQNRTISTDAETVRDYDSLLARILWEGSFISRVSWTLSGISCLSLGAGAVFLAYLNLRSRLQEAAILQIIGYPRRRVVKLMLGDFGPIVHLGCLLGLGAGWALGLTLSRSLSPAGIPGFFPPGAILLMAVFDATLLVTIGLVGGRKALGEDPVSVVARAIDVN